MSELRRPDFGPGDVIELKLSVPENKRRVTVFKVRGAGGRSCGSWPVLPLWLLINSLGTANCTACCVAHGSRCRCHLAEQRLQLLLHAHQAIPPCCLLCTYQTCPAGHLHRQAQPQRAQHLHAAQHFWRLRRHRAHFPAVSPILLACAAWRGRAAVDAGWQHLQCYPCCCCCALPAMAAIATLHLTSPCAAACPVAALQLLAAHH